MPQFLEFIKFQGPRDKEIDFHLSMVVVFFTRGLLKTLRHKVKEKFIPICVN